MSDPKPLPWDPALVDALRPRAKALLRKRYRGLRAALPATAVAERSAALCAHVMALDAWRDARTVALFRAMPEEVQLDALVADARARGVTVCLPVVVEGSELLAFRVAWSPEGDYPLEPGVWGIEEPVAHAPTLAPEAIALYVVPCLAVDPRGHRLGYGRGYYDRALALAPKAEKVAVAFEFQRIAEVPDEGHDVPATWVVTDRGAFRVAPDEAPSPPMKD